MIDCPWQDDEQLCDLPSCPWKCTCLHYAMSCENSKTLISVGRKPFIRVNITNTSLSPELLQQFTAAMILYLRENNITNFCLICQVNAASIKAVDISHNLIHLLDKSCLKPMKKVIHLNISHNLLEHIPGHFSGFFMKLRFIDISFNNISKISKDFFHTAQHIKAINILQERPVAIEQRISNERLLLLITNDYHVCCFKPKQTRCTATMIWPFTCSDLIDSTVLKVFLWVIALSLIIANIISFVISLTKTIKSSEPVSYDMIVMFQAISDFLVGLHLIIIAAADTYYIETYISNDIAWRSSGLCNFVSIFSIFSNVLSMYTLGFLSISRLQIVKEPLRQSLQEKSVIFKYLSIGLVIAFLIAAILVILTILSGSIQPLPLCVMYGLRGTITTTVSAIFGVLQLLATIFIIYIYSHIAVLLVNVAKKKKKLISQPTEGPKLTKIFVASITNTLCWGPTATLLLISVIREKYPVMLLFWAVLVLSPINSIVNPILLQFTSLDIWAALREKVPNVLSRCHT